MIWFSNKRKSSTKKTEDHLDRDHPKNRIKNIEEIDPRNVIKEGIDRDPIDVISTEEENVLKKIDGLVRIAIDFLFN